MARRKKGPPARDEDLGSRVDEDDLLKLKQDVEKGFENQRERSDDLMDNWDAYNCILSDKQFYNGTSQIATPFIQDAVEARVTRFTNQVFPQSGRYVDVVTNGEDPPQATQALMEHYVERAHLRTDVVPEMFRNGDNEGQWNVYVGWTKRTRHVATKVMRQPKTGGLDNEAAEPVEDVEEEEVVDSFPDPDVIPDADVCILPAACSTATDALAENGSVTILRRWSKERIKQLIDDGDIRETEGEALIETMNAQRMSKDRDTAKEQLDAAGVKERGKVAVVYETWKRLKITGVEGRRLCRIYFGGEQNAEILGVKLNPYWHGRCPLLSAPLKKKTGASKGIPPVNAVIDWWILANDTINEGADTAHYSAMPIVMTDPLNNPRADTMTLGLGSVWEVSPQSTEVVTFPALWQDALNRTMAIKDQIFQTLGVNPSMIPQSTGAPKKRNQAELAIEQQVDLLTTSDVVTVFEKAILTPMIEMFVELDQQFRDETILIDAFGEMGEEVIRMSVEPVQLGNRYSYRWLGVESARNAAMAQQQISAINVFRGLPPNLYQGYRMNVAPAIIRIAEYLFGPRIGPKVFEKIERMSTDPLIENEMLLHGFEVHTSPEDNDQEHIQVHMMALEAGDPHGQVQQHIKAHAQQLQAKMVAQMQQMGGGAPQGGGGGGGGPQQGAQVVPMRGMKQAPGAVHPDQMARAGAVTQPRKT